jgi:hypothetical protein
MSLSLTAPGVARVVVGSALYLTGVTLLASGTVALRRRDA